MTKPEFRQAAAEIPALLLGQQTIVPLRPKEFKSGRLGFHGHGTVFIEVGGVQVRHRVNFQLLAEGSQDWSE